MKNIFLIAIFLLLSVQLSEAKKLYVEMEYHKNSIKLDDGSNKKRQAIKDEQGKDLKFRSLIGALNYMSLNGWDLVDTKSVTSGGSYAGTGGTETKVYYIFCKDVSDEELQEAVNNSFKE